MIGDDVWGKWGIVVCLWNVLYESDVGVFRMVMLVIVKNGNAGLWMEW